MMKNPAGGNEAPDLISDIWEWWEVEREGLGDGVDINQLTGQKNARHMVEDPAGTPEDVPVNDTNQINGLAAARFDTQALLFPDYSALTAVHMFIIVKLDADPPPTEDTTGLWGTGAATRTHFPFTDSNIYEGFGSTTRQTVGNPAAALTSWRVYEIISTSSEYTVLLDGTQLFTTGTNTVGWGADRWLGRSHGTRVTLKGWVAGAYLASAKLTTDRAALITYINDRFALSSS